MNRIFGTLVAARARLYDRGVLPVYRLRYPVLSVGNLTTGGTGKTPLVIALAARLQATGYRPVILSRGYRRESRGVVVVSRGHGVEVDWKRSGDEPQLMALRLPGVAVVVGNDRYRAGLKAQDEDLGDLFLLDDGFQHRRLHRDMDIVTIDPREWADGERLLPEGRWREPRNALGRAHAACIQLGGETRTPELPLPTFEVETIVDGLGYKGEILPVRTLEGTALAAFAGIAKPERFFDLLESQGLTLASRTAFPDHHAFTARDLEPFAGQAAITTEKDAVRADTDEFYFLRISANIKKFNELHDLIQQRIQSHDAS